MPGDVIFIPPVGPTVGVAGEVRRPAIYELQGREHGGDLMRLAGGLTPEADPQARDIERIDKRRERVVVDVDLSGAGRATRGCDRRRAARASASRPTVREFDRSLRGHVYRPGSSSTAPACA